jgi:hypothetical protein
VLALRQKCGNMVEELKSCKSKAAVEIQHRNTNLERKRSGFYERQKKQIRDCSSTPLSNSGTE